MPRPARTGLSHLFSAESTGLTQLLASDRIVVATALEVYRLVTGDQGILECSGALEELHVSTGVRSVAGERTMSATGFRTKCLGLMDEVAQTGMEIVIANRGRPAARLVPFRRRWASPLGHSLDQILLHGDIYSLIEVTSYASSALRSSIDRTYEQGIVRYCVDRYSQSRRYSSSSSSFLGPTNTVDLIACLCHSWKALRS